MHTASAFDSLDPARKKIAFERAAARVREVRAAALPTLQQILTEVRKRMRVQTLRDSIPPKLRHLLKRSRYKGVHGGRGSTKSQTFGRLLLLRCIEEPGLRAVCVREVQKSLEQSVKRLLEDLIQKYDYGDQFKVLNTHIETPGGGIIIFQGMQNHTAESVKSLEGYKIAWVEEAQSLSKTSLELLRPTLREEDSELWFSWNPKDADDPVDELLRSKAGAPPNSIVVEMNFSDNPWFPEVLRKEMEWDQRRDVDKYNHVWLGMYQKHSQSRVFRNWRIEEFDTPADATFYFGSDWGFSVDPSTLVRCYLVEELNELRIDYEAYAIGVEIDDLPELFDAVPGSREWEIVADSARPETISYLQRHGFPRMVAAKKGPNSVKEGVIFLQNYNIVVHPRCVQTIKELTHYSYKVDKFTQVVTPILADDENHIIDPLRYATEKLRAFVSDDWLVA